MKQTAFVVILFLLLTIVVGASGCSFGGRDGSVVSKMGTLKYIDLNGWFYGIVSDDGEEYEVVNLGPNFQEDGLRVRFDAKILNNTNSVHMWGTVVELTNIEKIEGS